MTASDLCFEISSTDLLEWMELEEYKFETAAEGGGGGDWRTTGIKSHGPSDAYNAHDWQEMSDNRRSTPIPGWNYAIYMSQRAQLYIGK